MIDHAERTNPRQNYQSVRLVGGRSHGHYVSYIQDTALHVAGDTYFRVGEPWGNSVMATADIRKAEASAFISGEAYAAYGTDLITDMFEKCLLDVQTAGPVDPGTLVWTMRPHDRGYRLEMHALAEPADEDDPENVG